MRILILSFLFMLAAACAQAQDAPSAPDFNGAWNNDMGSLAIFVVKDGEVRGTYQTNVGQPGKSKKFPLIGFVQDDQITFTVNFKTYGSMTAWTGQLILDDKGTPTIRTLWHLTKDIEDAKEKEEIWGSIRTGASEFRLVAED